jgi:hypothetical protein
MRAEPAHHTRVRFWPHRLERSAGARQPVAVTRRRSRTGIRPPSPAAPKKPIRATESRSCGKKGVREAFGKDPNSQVFAQVLNGNILRENVSWNRMH